MLQQAFGELARCLGACARVPDLGSDNLAQQPAIDTDSIRPAIAAKYV
jgi:hypothetical protein